MKLLRLNPGFFLSQISILFGLAIALVLLIAVAGIFHGYAYGESIVGAEMTSVVAYLAGFAIIQLVIAFIALRVGKFTFKQVTERPSLSLRFAGFTIFGAGAVFLASAIFG